VYSEISRLVAKRVEADAAAGVPEAQTLVKSTDIDRKLVKQTVMTSVYGVTFVGARAQIRNRLKEREFEDNHVMYKVSCYPARVTLDCLHEMFQSAKGIKLLFLSSYCAIHWCRRAVRRLRGYGSGGGGDSSGSSNRDNNDSPPAPPNSISITSPGSGSGSGGGSGSSPSLSPSLYPPYVSTCQGRCGILIPGLGIGYGSCLSAKKDAEAACVLPIKNPTVGCGGGGCQCYITDGTIFPGVSPTPVTPASPSPEVSFPPQPPGMCLVFLNASKKCLGWGLVLGSVLMVQHPLSVMIMVV